MIEVKEEEEEEEEELSEEYKLENSDPEQVRSVLHKANLLKQTLRGISSNNIEALNILLYTTCAALFDICEIGLHQQGLDNYVKILTRQFKYMISSQPKATTTNFSNKQN